MNIRDVDDRNSIIEPTAMVSNLACIGAPGEWRDRDSRHPAIVREGVVVREFARVQAGCDRPTIVGEDSLLMAGTHVGHDAQLGVSCEVAPNAVIGGCVTIGDRVKIGMCASIRPFVTIGDGAVIGQGAVVLRDVPPGAVMVGNPARAIVRG